MAVHRTFIVLMIVLGIIAGCRNTDTEQSVPSQQPPGGAATIWTARTELFMEYPALIVGKEARFAAHLTSLVDFTAVTEGRLVLVFSAAEENRQSVSVEGPSSPGIFRPVVTFDRPGTYRLVMIIDGLLRDTIEVEGLRVYTSPSEVPPETEDALQEQQIPFLKEQQWKIEFRTEPARRRPLSSSVRASAEVVPRLNSEAVVPAPFTGVISVERNQYLPVVGQSVERGGRLAAMVPSAETPGGLENFSSRFIAARTNRSLAEQELERARRLRAIQGISEKEYQETESAFMQADATYQILSEYVQSDTSGQFSGTFILRAPLAGTIVEANIVRGRQIDAGEPLYRIIDTRSVWVRATVAATEIGRITQPRRAWLRLAGAEPLEIHERNGRLISVAKAIDPATRTFPVIFEVRNPSGLLRVGMYGEIRIATGSERNALVVPESALIEEEGRYTVYVHTGGESFARRDITLGERDGEAVEILSGVSEGERIVTVGAYQVRLASLSSQLPAHGHEH